MWCRLSLRKFSQKPAGFVSAADYAMGVEIRKCEGSVTDCEFHAMEMGRDLSASKASKVDIREQLPWAVPPLWHLTLVLWTVPWHDFPLCNGESGVLHTEGSQGHGWCWFTVWEHSASYQGCRCCGQSMRVLSLCGSRARWMLVPTFTFFLSQETQAMEGATSRGAIHSNVKTLETPSQTCPELRLLGDLNLVDNDN